MNQQQPIHRRRLTRAEIRRRRRNRAIRRIAGLTLVVCVAVGGVSFLLSRRKAPVPTADAAGGEQRRERSRRRERGEPG